MPYLLGARPALLNPADSVLHLEDGKITQSPETAGSPPPSEKGLTRKLARPRKP